jgi:hypothetical protein
MKRMKHIKLFEQFFNEGRKYINESKDIESLHKEIEKYYGRKLEPSQINTMIGRDNRIAKLLSKYRKLSRLI